MTLPAVALLSVHTSPLAQPGIGDGGGMNVYLRALGSALAEAGVVCDVFTRAEHAESPPVVPVAPGLRVVHLRAGPVAPLPKEALPEHVDSLVSAFHDHCLEHEQAYDLLHGHYWISAVMGHRLKHDLDVPLAVTFHTLERVKAAVGLGDAGNGRALGEIEAVRCADLLVVSTAEERDQLVTLYDAAPERVELVAPGVDHGVFAPGDRARARAELALDPGAPVLLFVGRIQALKAADVAIEALAALDDSRAVLLVVGGPSGAEGDAELARLRRLTRGHGLDDRVRFVPPQVHERLATYYRAADVCVVPSRSESFGLVALEAAACGVPVVAADVGGLREIVADGRTGILVAGPDPASFAGAIRAVLDDPVTAGAMGGAAAARSASFSWSAAAGRLRRLYGDLAVRAPVPCT